MTRRIIGVATLLTIAAVVAVHAQSSPSSLPSAKALKCLFTAMSAGDWNADNGIAATKPANLAISFEDIDVEEGSARVVGAFGPSDIVARLSGNTLHFMQSFREGPIYLTTIFPSAVRPGLLKAVHTRHEFTEVSLPGFTSRPEQYYGSCEITK